MVLIADDPDFGTDVALLSDLAPVWGFASGKLNIAYALARRLRTPRGGLFYDLDYGYDVTAWLNAAIDVTANGQLGPLKSAITSEVLKEVRIDGAEVTLDFSSSDQTLTITIDLDTADGPFNLVLAASSLTVEVLRIDGVQVVTAVDASTATVIVGPVGPAGPAGATGAAGGGGGGGTAALELDDTRLMSSSTGTEEVLFQFNADMGALPAGSLTGELSASVLSAAGTATFRLRLGGSDGVADGTVICTITHALASFLAKNGSGTFTNPTGLLPVKVTAQSSGAAVDAQIKGPVVTFR